MPTLERDELARVVRSVAEGLGGHGAMVTLHPDDSAEPTTLHIDGHPPFAPKAIDDLLGSLAAGRRADAGFAWLESLDDSGNGQWDGILLPVDRVVGHDGLAITVFFRGLDRERRPAVEADYRRHHDMAAAFFRLWQRDRIKRSKIDALEAALDLTALGVVLLDRAGRLIFANQAARGLLDAADGVRERHGYLQAAGLADGARLQAAINHAVGSDGLERNGLRAPMLTIHRPNRAGLIVLVVPATRPATGPADVAATVLAVDPETDTEQLLEPVCRLFKLSQVETRLTCQLAAGATLSEAATALRLKQQTARGYLQQVFLKTGTNRQTALVRTMLSSLVRTFQQVHCEIV